MISETCYSEGEAAPRRSAGSADAHPAACRRGEASSDLTFQDVYEFVEGRYCGYGSSSIVVEVRRRSDGRVFACKICNTDHSSSLGSINHEIEIMRMLRARIGNSGGDACIATYVDVFADRKGNGGSSTAYLIFELMKGADLLSSLAQRTGSKYSEDDARTVMKQLLRALVCLHDDAGVTHRDIKLDNILLPSELDHTKVQLSAFGLSAAGTSARPSMTQRCGTPLYAAPELLERSPVYGNKVDLWSSGVVMFVLLCGYPPFWGSTVSKLLLSIRDDTKPNFKCQAWKFVSEEAADLVQKLLEKDPSKRLSAREALLHPWLADH